MLCTKCDRNWWCRSWDLQLHLKVDGVTPVVPFLDYVACSLFVPSLLCVSEVFLQRVNSFQDNLCMKSGLGYHPISPILTRYDDMQKDLFSVSLVWHSFSGFRDIYFKPIRELGQSHLLNFRYPSYYNSL